MTSDVVLTAAMRSNLLSLQSTQNGADKTKSATSTKTDDSSSVTSDTSESFAASESLRDRASGLSSLLDGMGQSIQTITTSKENTEEISGLLDKAETIATKAKTTLSEETEEDASTQLSQMEEEYSSLIGRIDEIVENSGYRGVNLLAGDNLETFFNENGTKSITTEGADLSTENLGLSEPDFSTTEGTEEALAEVRSSKVTVTNLQNSLAESLSLIETREDFTSGMISTLTEGSGMLDGTGEEEGARLMALQTRQQLGDFSISLASQEQLSLLRLF